MLLSVHAIWAAPRRRQPNISGDDNRLAAADARLHQSRDWSGRMSCVNWARELMPSLANALWTWVFTV